VAPRSTARGTPITEETMQKAKTPTPSCLAPWADEMGRPRLFRCGLNWPILRLRKELDLFANLRPAMVLEPLVDASTLKADVVRGSGPADRAESTGGIYFGEPRGGDLRTARQRGFDTETYTTSEIERLARVAFELARKRQNRLCSVEKANVMQSGLFWRQTVTALQQREYADVELSHMVCDNAPCSSCGTSPVRRNRDVEYLWRHSLRSRVDADRQSRHVAIRTLGAMQESVKRHALYEPIHGSAPDIAGKGIANPLGQMLSFAMLLRHSFGWRRMRPMNRARLHHVLKSGLRTPDIHGPPARRGVRPRG